jgi:hypothetical protein
MEDKPMTIRAAVFAFLDQQDEPLIIKRDELHKTIYEVRGKGKADWNTIRKRGKEYADISGATFRCIDHSRSIWLFKPGAAKISGAIVD